MSTAISINSRKWNLVSKRTKLDEVVDTDVYALMQNVRFHRTRSITKWKNNRTK